MKRLALLAVTAVFALALSACGDNATKKTEVKTTTTEQTQPTEAAPASTTTTTTQEHTQE